MPRSTRPRRKYRPRPPVVSRPGLDEAFRIFEPLERFVRQLRADAVDCAQGEVLIRESSGAYCAAAPALEGWADFWLRLSEENGLGLDVGPFRVLARRLANAAPVSLDDVARAEAALRAQHRAFLGLPSVVLREAAVHEEIRHKLARLA